MSTPILGPGPPPPPLPPPPPDKRRNPADKVVLPPVKGQKLRVKKKKRETRKVSPTSEYSNSTFRKIMQDFRLINYSE